MGDFFQRLKRIFLSAISFGLIKYEDPAKIGPYIIDSMKKKLADLKVSAVPVIANQYRIERMLEMEQKKLNELDQDARAAVTQHEDDLAGTLLLQKESAQARVDDLKAQLEAARQHAVEAKQQIEMFQDELQSAEDRARNAQMRYQLATMRAQVQKFGMSPSLDEDVRALERIEERADQAYAESEAIGDVAAIGDKTKLSQVRQAARKQRADAALADLKAEMGLTDTERRFQKVDLSANQETQTVTTQPAPQEQQQTVGQKPTDDQGTKE